RRLVLVLKDHSRKPANHAPPILTSFLHCPCHSPLEGFPSVPVPRKTTGARTYQWHSRALPERSEPRAQPHDPIRRDHFSWAVQRRQESRDQIGDALIVLGINAYHGDSSACVLRDGKLIGATE